LHRNGLGIQLWHVLRWVIRQVQELLRGVATKPQQQRDMLLRLSFAGLSPLGGSAAPRAGSPEDEAAFAAKYSFLADDADRAVFLDFALKLLLYAPAVAPPPPRLSAAGAPAALNPLQPVPPAAAPAAGAPAAAAAQPAKLPPPGLALADLPRIEGKAPPKGAFLRIILTAGVRVQGAGQKSD
jgi:Proteasome stabiliser